MLNLYFGLLARMYRVIKTRFTPTTVYKRYKHRLCSQTCITNLLCLQGKSSAHSIFDTAELAISGTCHHSDRLTPSSGVYKLSLRLNYTCFVYF